LEDNPVMENKKEKDFFSDEDNLQAGRQWTLRDLQKIYLWQLLPSGVDKT
jgi:hypothetical protein